ncbi:MAG: M23 family metallopeptidase, partial [Glaciecola sp.]|nr:M23 family metallopeptidase [Glaciecola sp.]
MKLTITFSHNTRLIERSVSVRKLLSLLVLTSLLFLISSRSTQSVDDNIQRVQLVKQGLLAQQEIIFALQQKSKIDASAIIDQVAKLEYKLSQLASQQQKLALNNNDKLVFSDNSSYATVKQKQNINIASSIEDKLVEIEHKIAHQVKQLEALEKIYQNTHIDNEQYISGRPITSGWLSSYYGMRDDPFTDKVVMHKGIDFAAAEGDKVIATAAGVITWSGERFGYGNLVEIDHGNGLVTRYGHNQLLLV